jgi:NAD(P)H-dependent flavin oxidoreductase YrpB (nitropropane dioxygenase family)
VRTQVCDDFDIEFPIFAFTHCRDVVAAVSRAGGFGVLGALGFSPEQLEVELSWIDEHVDGKPYGVDTVIPASYVGRAQGGLGARELADMIPAEQREFSARLLEKYDVPPLPDDLPKASGLLGWSENAGRAHVEVALGHPIKLIANALGSPPGDLIEAAHAHDIRVAGLVGRPDQALRQVERGVDLVVASGWEAGGHTGEISTLVLIPDVVDAVAPTPVLAAGGIGSGRQMAAAIALGAQGVWTGSIWLTVSEADTPPVLMDKLLAAGPGDTVRSRSLTGKPARQLRTPYTEAWDGPDSPGALPMPLQFMAVADAQRRISHYAHVERTGAAELIGTPAGQIIGRAKHVRPAHELIREIVEEYVDTMERMDGLMAREEDR